MLVRFTQADNGRELLLNSDHIIAVRQRKGPDADYVSIHSVDGKDYDVQGTLDSVEADIMSSWEPAPMQPDLPKDDD